MTPESHQQPKLLAARRRNASVTMRDLDGHPSIYHIYQYLSLMVGEGTQGDLEFERALSGIEDMPR